MKSKPLRATVRVAREPDLIPRDDAQTTSVVWRAFAVSPWRKDRRFRGLESHAGIYSWIVYSCCTIRNQQEVGFNHVLRRVQVLVRRIQALEVTIVYVAR